MIDPATHYLQRTPAGAEYVNQITASQSDRDTRAAFQALVLREAASGATLFDFGAGPGIDARFFAERGFRVHAYDVDPRMRAFFADYCRDLVESGRVRLDCSTYEEFLSAHDAQIDGRVDLVVSDFAPLNLVAEPRELFAKFHALTRPGGRVLASVLTPYFIDEVKTRLWWRNAPRLWRHGHFLMPGPQAPHHKRLIRNFSQLSWPYFRLRRIYRGLDGSAPARHGLGWLQLARSRYMFLLFEKQDAL